jgi:hypothetical protein
LAPHAFNVQTSLHAHFQNNPNYQLEPIGVAWILSKIGSLSSDCGQDHAFFSM